MRKPHVVTVAGHRRAARYVRRGYRVVAVSSNFLAPARITLQRG